MRKTSDEFTAEILGQTVYVRFRDESEIERAAQELLNDAGMSSDVGRVPVAVEEILERHLNFHLEFGNLEGALGATFPDSRTVVIDESLDPSTDVKRLGRYRFTIAHLGGHLKTGQ